MRACTEENAAMLDELLLSQEDQPQVHRSTSSVAQSAVIRIIFDTANLVWRDAYWRSGWRKNAIYYARLSCSKQYWLTLSSFGSLIWITDSFGSNLLTLAPPRNSQNDRPATASKKDIAAKRFFSHKNDGDGDSRHVDIGLHWFDVRQSRS